MSQMSLHLSPKFRLDLKLVRKRGVEVGEPIFPDIDKLRRARSGHKFSRFFRHIFEHKNIKKILGSNLALVVLATSTLTGTADAYTAQDEPTVITTEDVNVDTQRSVEYPVHPVIVNQGYHLGHPGVDFEGVTGDPVNPILAGVIEKVAHSNYALGNAVLIRHNGELSSVYAHLSKITVEEGQSVTTDTIIGEVGATGHASGDHLHFEVHQGNFPINPFSILPR